MRIVICILLGDSFRAIIRKLTSRHLEACKLVGSVKSELPGSAPFSCSIAEPYLAVRLILSTDLKIKHSKFIFLEQNRDKPDQGLTIVCIAICRASQCVSPLQSQLT